MTCTAQDQCHAVGTCDPLSGICTNPTKSNGATCDDGNACTSGDSCQAGSCVAGTQTCASITMFRNPFSHGAAINITATASASPPTVVPGDLLTFTSTVTNDSVQFQDDGVTEITNTGTTPFTVGSYQQTMEYFSLATQTWIPFAKVSYDSTGAEVDDPNLVVIQTGGLFGAVVPSGGAPVGVSYVIRATVPSDIVNLLTDVTRVNGVRDVLHIDTGAGTPGVSAEVDVSDGFTLEAQTLTGLSDSVQLAGNGTSDVAPMTGLGDTIPPGASITYTGSLIATPFRPRSSTESDRDYVFRINSPFYEAFTTFSTPHQGSVTARTIVNTQVPNLTIQKGGPAQGNAGLTLPYTVQLQNFGLASAGPFGIVDTVNGNAIAAQVSTPPSLAPGASGTATVNAASPVDQPVGSFTDTALVTWQDRNGNVYGPISAAFTTNIVAGHPEGYLTLVATGGGGPQILGAPVTLTATALDGLGHPVANLPLQLAIAGSNAQSTSLVTGSDGTASFTYDGPTLGRDTATVTATINGPTLQASVPTYTWASSDGPPCVGRTTPLDVMLLIDGSPSMFTNNTVPAAQAAADAFIGDLNPDLDQVAAVFFNSGPELAVPFTSTRRRPTPGSTRRLWTSPMPAAVSVRRTAPTTRAGSKPPSTSSRDLATARRPPR